MTQTIHGTGKVVIMDSGFCVLEGILQLKRVGVYCSALIKKRKFWPKHVDGDKLAEHFHNKAVGTADARLGVKDGRSFYIYAMKEPDYTMMMMATYGNMQEVPEGNAKRTYKNGDQTTTTTFKYTTPFYNHFKFRHQVDDHNAKRHAPISVEDCLGARRWDVRQFSFLLALTEVNVKLGIEYGMSDDKITPMLAFRKRLAKSLIFNPWFVEEIEAQGLATQDSTPTNRKRRRNEHHELLMRPNFTGKYDAHTRKFCTTKKRYVRLLCSSCREGCRTYCRCDPSIPLCKVCYGKHEIGN